VIVNRAFFDVWRSEGRKPVDGGSRVRKVIGLLASGHSSLKQQNLYHVLGSAEPVTHGCMQ
jgi:hypothetical protein